MLAKVQAAALSGLGAVLVTVEVDLAARGFPAFSIVGLPDKSVAEARERVRAAIVNSGFEFPGHRITVNLAPANLPKEGAGYDLAIAVGILAAAGQFMTDVNSKVFLGELALDGEVRSVPGALLVAKVAADQGTKELFLPEANLAEACLIKSISLFCPRSLSDLINHLRGNVLLESRFGKPIKKAAPGDSACLIEIKGQKKAKRALEIATAGGHNLRMIGPPGTGKTLLAQAMVSILPPLTEAEIVELTGIYSVAGNLPPGESIVNHPPFRSPHHTTSYAGMIGGGASPKPGEITLAHRGALFLDEFTEFPRHVLEALRQPLEQGRVWITRAQGNFCFPCQFILVAAHNPCPCGFRGSRIPGKTCRCGSAVLDRYYRKLSGPILDRIDLHVWLKWVRPEELSGATGNGVQVGRIRKRILAARTKQKERFRKDRWKLNRDLSPGEIGRFCQLRSESQALLNQVMITKGLSARSYHRVIKIARTIADLAGSQDVNNQHVGEALSYRWELLQEEIGLI